MNIKKELFKNQDLKYHDFTSKLIPNIDSKTIIGVRIPIIKKLAKIIFENNEYHDFLQDLPHKYHEENLLHVFIVSNIKDYNICLNEVNLFLNYIDNWAVSDSFSPKIFYKNKNLLIKEIFKWLKKKETYILRFAISMMMKHYLDDDFKEEYLIKVINNKNDDYYFKMMVSWYLCVALIKQYDITIKYLENKSIDIFIHNMTIQKAIDSYRIDKIKKEYLKSLRI